MKKLICKSILAAIAVGLVSISYVSADTVDQSVSINHSEVASKSKKEHVVPVKNIDSSRYELLGNYPVTKISNKTIDEYNKERMIP